MSPRTPSIPLRVVRAAAVVATALAPVLATAGATTTASDPAARPGRPLNLILVLVDTARADHLGYHGYERPTTPRLDALAAESVAFVNHYSHASRTGPSVASLFTGLHPRSHGVVNPLTHFDAKGSLAPENETLAERLSEAGYRCHGVVGNLNVGPRFGFGQGFEDYELLPWPIGSALLSRVKRMGLERSSRPFFLYLHYMEPHSSYDAPAPYGALFREGDYAGPITGEHAQLDQIVGGALATNEADRRHLTALYDQELRYFDDMAGELFDWLAETGLDQRSILVFVADHGEELFDHGSVLHGYTLYEEQLHVPLLIRDPRRGERAPGPLRVEALTRHVDVLPTLLDLLGLPLGPNLQGASLAPLMAGAADPAGARPLFAQASLNAVRTVQSRALLADGWKLIETQVPEARAELYHLTEDPREQRDLIEREPERAARLRLQLEAFERDLPARAAEAVDLTSEELEALRALGYVK